MGLLGDNEDSDSRPVDEVEISAAEPERDESELMNEVESKFGSRKKTSKSSKSSSVSLEDIHRQNEKIISLLEDLTDDKNSPDTGSNSNGSNDDFVGGDMNGVL